MVTMLRSNNFNDPRKDRRWQKLAPEHKAALIEASEWLYHPETLAKFDGSADFPVHPNNRSISDVMVELVRRAYTAGGYALPEKPMEARLEDGRAMPDSTEGKRYTHTDLLLTAAKLEMEAQRSGPTRY